MITLSRRGSGGKVYILGLHYYIPLYYIIIIYPEMYSWVAAFSGGISADW